MNREQTNISQEKDRWPLKLSLAEDRRAFLESLPGQRRIRSLDLFANRLACRHRKSLGADSLKFIRSYLADKFAPPEVRGFSTNMIYKNLAAPTVTGLHTLPAQFFFSLNISHSTRRFDMQAQNSYRFQSNATTEQLKVFLQHQSVTETLKLTKEFERSTVILKQRERESLARSEAHSFVHSLVMSRKEFGNLQPQQAIIQAVTAVENKTRSIQGETHLVLRNLERVFHSLQNFTRERDIKTSRTERFAEVKYLRALSPDPADRLRLTVHPFEKRYLVFLQQSHARAGLSIRNVALSSHKPTGNQAAALKGSSSLQAVLARSAGQETIRNILRLVATEAYLSAQRSIASIPATENNLLPRLAGGRLADFARIPEMKRAILAGAQSFALQKRLAPLAVASEEIEVEKAYPGLTVVRRGETAEAPPLRFELVQPMRPIADDQRVIQKVNDREVVTLIQKEVQGLMASSSAMMKFSRTDYERIADKVYASLVRRLVVEKERLGLR